MVCLVDAAIRIRADGEVVMVRSTRIRVIRSLAAAQAALVRLGVVR